MSRSRAPRLRIKDLPPEMKDAARAARRREAAEECARTVRHFERSGLPRPTTEHQFAPPRLWRLDLAWPAHQLALEVEGGVWTEGRHTRGSGFLRDMAKYNRLAALGWRLLRVTPEALYEPATVELVREALSPPPASPPSSARSASAGAGRGASSRSARASR